MGIWTNSVILSRTWSSDIIPLWALYVGQEWAHKLSWWILWVSIYRGGHCSSGELSYFTQGQSGKSRIQILIWRLQVLHVFHPPLLTANKHQHKASSEANQSSDGAYAGCFSSLKMLPRCYLMAPYLLLCKCSAPRCWTSRYLVCSVYPQIRVLSTKEHRWNLWCFAQYLCPKTPGTVFFFFSFMASVPMQKSLKWGDHYSHINH